MSCNPVAILINYKQTFLIKCIQLIMSIKVNWKLCFGNYIPNFPNVIRYSCIIECLHFSLLGVVAVVSG